ncbi:10989_t:CDS:2, partial [Paraglomus brasilianum]
DDLYSPDEDDVSLKRFYEYTLKFPDPKYMFNLKEKGLTTPEKFVAWWNGNNPDFQITVDAKMRTPPAIIVIGESMEIRYSVTYTRVQAFFNEAI